jgi:mutator protein MutT
MKPTVDAVALIVTRDGRLLVEKRSKDKATDPGITVVPGGHVEKGESLEEACSRELMEELGLNCDTYMLVETMLWETPIETQRVHYFLCEGWTGEPQSREADTIFFIGLNELSVIDVAEEREVIRRLLSGA